MGKIKRLLRCHHCGIVLQCVDEFKRGYISPEVHGRENAHEQVLYCNQCYNNLIAIHDESLKTDLDNDILTILEDAVASDAMILWVIDSFAFNGSLNERIAKKIKHLKVVVICNKYDLISKKVSVEVLKEYVKDRFVEYGIEPIEIMMFKNAEPIDSEVVLNNVNKIRAGHDVYMIGSLLSGKTSIINKMLKTYKNRSKRLIKTELYEGTSSKVLEIPLSNSSFLYELPGFSLANSIYSKVEKEVQKVLTPRTSINMFSKVVDVGYSVLFGNIVAISLEKGRLTNFKFYIPQGIENIKVKTSKMEEVHNSNLIRRFSRPVSERFSTFSDYDVLEFEMENDDKMHDISISGFGWFSFKAKGQVIRIYIPKGIEINECLSKIK